MQFKSTFPILIAHPDVGAQSVAGVRLRNIQLMTDSIIDYLKFARDTGDRFPGFEADILGLRFDLDQAGHKHWLVDCVKE